MGLKSFFGSKSKSANLRNGYTVSTQYYLMISFLAPVFFLGIYFSFHFVLVDQTEMIEINFLTFAVAHQIHDIMMIKICPI